MLRLSGHKLTTIVVMLSALFSLLFAQITFAQTATPAPSQVELTGVIDTVDGSTITIAQQVVDVSQAELKVSLEVGLRVKVEGALAADGHIIARQVKSADAAIVVGAESEIVGVLTSFEGGTMVIGGQTIDVSRAEIYPGVAVNETVEAKASLIDGILVAREVQLTNFSSDNSPVTLPTDCVATQPDGWTTYTIQAGDTLSAIAHGSDTSLRQLEFVNCIASPGSIVAGTTIFVPQTPVFGSGDDLNDDHGQDGPGHDLNDDHGQDGPGHDVGDDHGQDSGNHDQGDDNGQDGPGHDQGDDNGGSGHG